MLKQTGSLQNGESASSSVEAIRAHGDIKTKLSIILFVGTICGILAIGGIIAFFINPASAKDIWVIIGPIITAGVTGTVSYFAGEQKN